LTSPALPSGRAATPREIIAESLWRANRSKTASARADFSDVSAANRAAIDWAVEAGVVNGMGGGKFGTGWNVSRQDFAVMLWRAAGKPPASGSVRFGDAAAIADYARDAAAWTEGSGIINGIGGSFELQSSVTRAQVAAILQRYLTKQEGEITLIAAGLVKVYEQLGWHPAGKVAVKVSTGEPPASNYLRAELIGDLVRSVSGTIVECNTAYGGSRAASAMHKQVAADHGFTAIADFDLMDEDGEASWPVTGGKRLDHILVGSHAENYPDWLILSHYKGHAMAGFGGAIKNVGIGASSSSGKVLVHSVGTRTSDSIMYSDQDAWLEALAEMVDGFVDHVGKEHIVYVNVMNRLSVDCDCDGRPAEPDSDADLNWNDRESRSTREQNDKSVRPGIASKTVDLSGYATIYVGFPIWWGEEPRILDTFVESYDFSGKTMIPFCTSSSSGIGSSGRNMEQLTSGATWLDGRRFGGSVSVDELGAWADGLQ